MIKVTFVIDGEPRTVEVDLASMAYSHHGLPGSLLDIAKNFDIPLEHACGGSCACTTCHVVVTRGGQFLSPAEENEEDMLDRAPGLTPTSRLGCQAVVGDPGAEIHVRIPRHTVNLISGHGG